MSISALALTLRCLTCYLQPTYDERVHSFPTHLRIDALFFCPHTADENCGCRKPKTGMYEEIAARFHADLKGVPCVGDGLRDLQAAETVGGQPILVLTGKGKKTQAEGGMPKKTLVFANLAEAARHLVA